MKKIFIFSAIILLFVTGCENHIQTTSGQSYLDKYKNNSSSLNQGNIEQEIRKVASVEPALTFPARIGLARIDRGQLSAIPGEEAEAWVKVRDKLGNDFGEFIPLSPLVAEMVSENIAAKDSNLKNEVMNKIRLGAARQHLDAVLIYETYSKTEIKDNFLSIADITIIGGYLLPSRETNAVGYANAMLIDVIQGYPYGTADVTLDKEEILTPHWGFSSSIGALSETVKTKAVIKLSDEVEAMFLKLRSDLDKKSKTGKK